MSLRAGELQPDGLPAVAVRKQCLWSGWAGGVALPPLHQGDEHRVQVQALVGQAVLEAGSLPVVLVRNLTQQALPDQAGEPVAEDLPGRLAAPLPVAEPADRTDRSPHH